MTQGTVRSSNILLLKTLSDFVQSSFMMRRQHLPGRKYVRTFFLVVNLCSLKARWGVFDACYVSSKRYVRLNSSYIGVP